MTEANDVITEEGDLLLERVRMANESDLKGLASDLRVDAVQLRDLDADARCQRLVDELRSAAGHTVMNAARTALGGRLSYRDILIDVADKLTPGLITRAGFHDRPEADELAIEDYIADEVHKRAAERLQALSPEDRRQVQSELERNLREQGATATTVKTAGAAVASGSISGLVLASATSAALYSGLWTTLVGVSARQVLVGGLAVGGPVGILAGVAMFLTSPSYGKTIPAVVRLVFIRHSHEQRQGLMRDAQ